THLRSVSATIARMKWSGARPPGAGISREIGGRGRPPLHFSLSFPSPLLEIARASCTDWQSKGTPAGLRLFYQQGGTLPMLNKTRLAITATVLLLAASVASAATKSDFQDAMRRLWSDHVAYTRLFIVDAAAGSADKDATTQRLLQNQADIGNAVAEFYGRDAGDKLTALLKDHILIAANIVAAAKAGDNAKVASENKRWRDNATEIATFLHGANPKHWPLATLQSAMFTHLDQTLDEATHQLKGDYAGSVKDYEHVVEHILGMADVLSNGIIAQFPAKF